MINSLPNDIDEQAKENFFKYIRENQAKCLLLLDGLDEADSFKLDMYYSLVQSKLLPACNIVITSRHEAGKKVRPYCDTLWEIVGFTNEDAESFIRKYFKGESYFDHEKKEDTVKLINFGFLSFQQGGDKRQPCTRYAFLHKRFQEFFAGLFLALQVINKGRDFTSVVDDKRYLDKQRQVFLFMSGIIASRSEETAVSFVSGIAKKLNSAGYRKYMSLACECLSECSSVKESLETR